MSRRCGVAIPVAEQDEILPSAKTDRMPVAP